MADGFISPATGITMWTVTAALMALCARKVAKEPKDRIPLMGIMGAFVFACQMLNFTIPGTGSSGHLTGGLLLAILLGPYAGFLVMSAVLVVQALFFADGGILALGCNMFNMGFFTCFVAYPLLYKPFIGEHASAGRISLFCIIAAVIGLQLGAFSVVVETTASGITALPFVNFVELMQPIHLAIGVVEGLATTAVVLFLRKTQPVLLTHAAPAPPKAKGAILCTLAALTLLFGGAISWFASSHPDGLEWSIAGVTGTEETELAPTSPVHDQAAALQEKTAFMPDYALPTNGEPEAESSSPVNPETSMAGIVGSGIVLLLIFCLSMVIKLWTRKHQEA